MRKSPSLVVLAMLTDAACLRYSQHRALKLLMRPLLSLASPSGLFLSAFVARGDYVPLNSPRISENAVKRKFRESPKGEVRRIPLVGNWAKEVFRDRASSIIIKNNGQLS
jgi:hypothetical protein